MASKKYDWAALKLEFFKGDSPDVGEFFQKKYGIDIAKNGNVGTKIAGWKEERQKYLESITQEALSEAKEELKDEAKVNFHKKLISLHKDRTRVLEIATAMLEEGMTVDDAGKTKIHIHYKALKAIWEILKTEMGEPTHITKNENTNANDNTDLAEKIVQAEEKRAMIKELLQSDKPII